MKTSLLGAIALIATPAAAQVAPALTPAEAAMKAHVSFLAADVMQGREAGTAEYEIAAHYVAAQLLAAGVEPMGTNGSFLQSVPLVSARSVEKGSFTASSAGAAVPLTWGSDFLTSAGRAPSVALSAPVVFVGYGVVDQAGKRDDYAGLDVRGKIVAWLAGAPAGLPGEVRAHYGNAATKAVEAQRRGAIGSVTLYTPTQQTRSQFSRLVDNWQSRSMTWAAADGTPYYAAPTVPGLGTFSLQGGAKLLAGSKFDHAAIMAADKAGTPIPRGGLLPVTLTLAQKTEIERKTSSNVIGIIRGSDPKLAAEHVVLSAHLDHVGVGTPIAGDSIYNGAMDNAVGIGSMIEVARAFAAAGTKPKRSILFVALTAEEKGLVGADYFARNPTVPKAGLVANVNLDMPIITYRFTDLIAFGADRSQLGGIVGAAAGKLGFKLTPDATPEEALFTRSDHYRFVQQGVPAVFLKPGPSGPGAAADLAFRRDHYHRPSDEIALPIDWTAGANFVRVNYEIARAIADAPERPRWNKGDFFGSLYKGFGAN